MRYFQTLPTVNRYYNNNDYNTVTNILTRAYLLPQLQNNIQLFYQYNVKDSDRPEIIAHKYYNDINKYWLVMFANGMFDPIHDWPLSSQNFLVYLQDKYGANAASANTNIIAYTKSHIHHYEQITTLYDTSATDKETTTIQIDVNTYANLITSTTSSTFENGIILYKVVDKRAVSLYDYEYETNENKRTINLIKDIYATDMENLYGSIMRSNYG